MRIGYARVSTKEQDIDSQVARLTDCERVFSEKWSGKDVGRPELAQCLTYVREGDTLVITRLDRLARSLAHLCSIADTLARKGVSLVVLDQAIDTTTPSGKLLFHMLGAIAEFELGLRKEQQRAGIAHARAVGKNTGRPVRLPDDRKALAVQRMRDGAPIRDVATDFRVSKSTLRRYLRDAGGFDAT